ncbi:hypothetical protein DAPPUDRAFT_321436 [Daphnia pulex]|uniref:Uncharacterized protein n=1 Tax=Daphnia pulex TaxID=6669 RepID=E9GSW6_DAPPU|nr:hypothetical protein DAPPUDRAFT_321436 [Daphnia pulex]|eukprot:EFX77503.1 hypothetical protein DAPPUDRAFT_321436 [Daphnia pulex]
MADEDQNGMVDAQTLFAARTTAKRKHTNTVKRVRTLIVNAASRAEFEAFMPTLMDAINELVDIHERYVAAAELDAEEREAAGTYLQGIQQLHNTCVEAINRVRQVRVGRQGWNVSNSGHVPNRPNPRDEQPESLNNTIPPHDSASAIQQPEPLDNNGHLSVPDEELEPTDQLTAAKKRKLDLEFLLVHKNIQQERDVKDLATKNEREHEDLMIRIRRESQLLAGFGACRAVAFEDYHFTSSPLQTYQNNLPGAFVPTNPSTSNIIHQAPVTPRHHNSSYREPRLMVERAEEADDEKTDKEDLDSESCIEFLEHAGAGDVVAEFAKYAKILNTPKYGKCLCVKIRRTDDRHSLDGDLPASDFVL